MVAHLVDRHETVELEQDLDHFIKSNIAECYSYRAKSDALEDERNPRMIRDVLQAVKGLAENQIAHYIERGPVVPSLNVESLLAALTVLVDSLDQEIYVVVDKRLLFTHGAVREAMRQSAAEFLMLVSVRSHDGRRDAPDHVIEGVGLGHFLRRALRPDSVPVDILPCPRVREGQMIRPDANDRAVLVV
jgi:hypothetical protein